jgi:hypothetical protein
MNSIHYGFHRLYLHYASDEVFETAAIGRISIKDKEATDEEVILAEEGVSSTLLRSSSLAAV